MLSNVLTLWSNVKAKMKDWHFRKQISENKFICTVKDGWVKVDFEVEQFPAIVQEAVELLSRNPITEANKTWMKMIKPHSRSELIGLSVYALRQEGREETVNNLKRLVSAGAVIYGYEVPNALWMLDKQTVHYVLGYMGMTRPIHVDLDNYALDGYVPTNLDKRVNEILHVSKENPVLFELRRPVNFYALMKDDLTEQEMLARRKELTCVYLIAGLPVPRDYCYVDVEVYDFVKRAGAYENRSSVMSS